MLDKSLYCSFVDPNICKQLVDEGLTVDTPYHWICKGKDAELFTLSFDVDRYYAQAQKNVDFIDAPVRIPAFQTGDMVKLLPDHMLVKNNNEWELACSDLFDLQIERAPRMPDVYAWVVLKAFKQRKLNVQVALKTITP
jgi:hypothetical protein